MSIYFRVKKGLVSEGTTILSGSLLVKQPATFDDIITGSIQFAETASIAATASYVESSSYSESSSFSITSSYSETASYVESSSFAVSSSYSQTASYALDFDPNVEVFPYNSTIKGTYFGSTATIPGTLLSLADTPTADKPAFIFADRGFNANANPAAGMLVDNVADNTFGTYNIVTNGYVQIPLAPEISGSLQKGDDIYLQGFNGTRFAYYTATKPTGSNIQKVGKVLDFSGSFVNLYVDIVQEWDEEVEAGASVLISASAPVSQSAGTLWFNTDSDSGNGGELYIQLSDSGSTWIPVVDKNVDQAVSSSYALTASYVNQAVSSSFAVTSSIANSVKTTVSSANSQHSVLFVNTTGNTQTDAGLRYNPSTNLLTTTASLAVTAVTASTNTLAYAAIGISNIPAASNSDMTPTLLNGNGITVSGNTITIARPGVYLMNASIAIRASFAEYAWVDASNNRLTGTTTGLSVSANSSDPAGAANAMGIVNITSPNTVIKLRIYVGAGFAVQNTAYAVATITQLR